MNNNIEKEFSQIREESKEGMEIARGTAYNSNADSWLYEARMGNSR